MRYTLGLFVLFTLLLPGSVSAHEDLTPTDGSGKIGIAEKTGQMIPPDLVFSDEAGRKVRLAELFGKPAIITLVYYTCEHICPQMLGGLSQALPRLEMTPLRDYRVITVSIDPSDTPAVAAAAKNNYLKAMGKPFPFAGWKFLTGNEDQITSLARAVGFSYRRDIHGFTHPVALIFISPSGKISGYYYVTQFGYGAAAPISFSSFDLNMGLAAAAQGKPITGVRKAILYCFSHEPPGQSRFFTFMAGMGALTLVAMIALFTYLQVSSRRFRKGNGYDSEG
ncbi:MAG: SCO family protein [Smithellaceae bacterium]|nr:SCO family protein [Smithellaceae bacterium]